MKLFMDLGAVIDLNRPVIIDSTGVNLPNIIAVDWIALKWFANNTDLYILLLDDDPRLKFIEDRINIKRLSVYDQNQFFDYRILEKSKTTVVLNEELEEIYIAKRGYGQGLLAELAKYFEILILDLKQND